MNRIKELRLEKGLSQKDLAKFLQVNQTAVGKYERGDLEPNIQTLLKLSNYFECSIDYLVGRSDDFGNVNVLSPAPSLSKDEQEILDQYRGMSLTDKMHVQAYVKVRAEESAERKKKA